MGKIQDTEKIAELCGAIVGDGWIQNNEKSFFVAGDPSEDKEYYDGRLSKLFEELLESSKPKEFPYWKVYGISIHKKYLIQKILSWEIQKGKKCGVAKIPKWIYNGTEKTIKSFLRGLFDADGSVFCQKSYGKYNNKFDKKYHSKIRLRITSVSKQLIEEVFYLCEKIGLRVTHIKLEGGWKHNRNCSEVHILNINEMKSIGRWFEEISPSNPKHTTKYLIWKEFGFCPPWTTISQRKEILKKNLDPYSFY